MESSARVRSLMEGMTLAEKVGQIFVFTWRNQAQAQNDLRLHPGGYLRIYSDVLSVAKQTRELQQQSRIPLIIAADFERGIGGTISGALEIVTAMAIGATGDDNAAFDAGFMIGVESLAMGINANYAPVLDINCNPANPVINTRSYGADPKLVARLGIAFSRGLQQAGLATCGKHFPGHGDTGFDSHSSLGKISADRDRIEKIELYPFRAAIAAGVDAIMSAHLIVPAFEPENIPATLSKRIMTDLLRIQMGFTGVAVTDALDMAAVAEYFPPETAVPMAINAGCDQLIMPEDNNLVVDILTAAVNRGEVSMDRLDEAVYRVLNLKENRGMLDASLPNLNTLYQMVNVPEHIARANHIAEQSITVISNDNAIPIAAGQDICCITVSGNRDGRSNFMEPQSFPDYLAANGWQVSSHTLGTGSGEIAISPRLDQCIQESAVIVLALYINIELGSGKITMAPELVKHINEILALNKSAIVVSFGSPYVINSFPDAAARLCAFSSTQASQRAMAKALKGEIQCTGTLPVTLA